MAPKYGNPYERINKLRNIFGLKQDETTGVVSGYILERKLKRMFRESGFNGQEITTIDMKVERLGKDRLQDIIFLIEQEGCAEAIKEIGLQYQICICRFEKKPHLCKHLKSECTCCVNCKRRCNRLFNV